MCAYYMVFVFVSHLLHWALNISLVCSFLDFGGCLLLGNLCFSFLMKVEEEVESSSLAVKAVECWLISVVRFIDGGVLRSLASYSSIFPPNEEKDSSWPSPSNDVHISNYLLIFLCINIHCF